MKKLLFSTLLLAAAPLLRGANPVPADPSVRIGTLPNGLTYYLKQNASPAGQVDFFLAQRVGSVNEEENQRGLAHFLEHMCFNGTENFPGNSLIEYLESNGVKFGRNLNAYTSTDETVYNICEVPSAREAVLDSCVMILGDWSGRLLLDPAEIDAERGVIKGEMRQRSTPGSRILTRLAPTIYQGNIYGDRMPIGLLDVIENFTADNLRDYYRKWYHPGNQAVIIVGDIDPDRAEASVRKHFEGLGGDPLARKAMPVTVADNDKPVVAVGSDKEQSGDMIQFYVKEPALDSISLGTIDEVRRDYIRSLVSEMLVGRFDILENDPECSWSNLGIGLQKFLLSGTRSALMLRGMAYDAENALKSIATFDTELLRAALHGFTDTELQRAKLSLRNSYDSDYANASTITNTEYGRRFARHFTRGGVIPSPESLYKMMKGVERTTSLDDVNAYFSEMVRPDGRNVIVSVYAAPADSAALAPEKIESVLASVDTAAIEPYTDTFTDRPLLSSEPVAGNIVKSEEGPFGSRLLTLSNGIKVYLRHSDSKPDQVLIEAISPGGFAMNYDPVRKAIYKTADDVIAVSGFGGHSSTDLRKLLAGHNVKTAVKISNTTEELIGVTTPSDLETTLQLLYLKATDINRDDNAFNALMKSTRSKLDNPSRTATSAMGDTIHSIVYNRHPLGEKLYLRDLPAVNYDSIIALHRDRFADMSDFTYIITGNFSADSIDSLVTRYIASLPGGGRVERPTGLGYGYFKGEGRFDNTWPMTDTPQSITYSFYNGECPFDLKHVLLSQTFGSILKSRLMTEVREKRGLTYGINSHCSVTTGFDGPDTASRFILPVYIKVQPGHEDEVIDVVKATVADLMADGPTAAEVDKVKAYLAKEIIDNRDDNGYWQTVIKVYDQYGPDMDSAYDSLLEELTPGTVREFGRKYLDGADHVVITMRPE